jgi:hypothetical protein
MVLLIFKLLIYLCNMILTEGFEVISLIVDIDLKGICFYVLISFDLNRETVVICTYHQKIYNFVHNMERIQLVCTICLD